MTPMSDQELIEALLGLGAPKGVTTALWAAGDQDGLIAALQSVLGVRRVRSLNLAADDNEGALRLIVSRSVLDQTRLRDLSQRLEQLRRQLDAGGILAMEIRTGLAPVGPEARSLDHVLFPQMAAQGQLSGEAATLTPLTASGWMSLLEKTGFEVVGVEGFGAQPPSPAVSSLHFERLALFDATELSSGVIRVVARKREEAA